MQLKDLAAGLGISPSMVTKLKKRGMPVGSVEAAEKWRRRHLEAVRTKGIRAGTERAAPAALKASVAVKDVQLLLDARTEVALRQVRELGLLANDALGRGTFATVAPMLRQAMARVPIEARGRIGLTVEVWDALTAAIPLDLDPTPEQAAAGDLDDDFMGTFWMQIALGEYQDMHIDLSPVSTRNACEKGDGG